MPSPVFHHACLFFIIIRLKPYRYKHNFPHEPFVQFPVESAFLNAKPCHVRLEQPNHLLHSKCALGNSKSLFYKVSVISKIIVSPLFLLLFCNIFHLHISLSSIKSLDFSQLFFSTFFEKNLTATPVCAAIFADIHQQKWPFCLRYIFAPSIS